MRMRLFGIAALMGLALFPLPVFGHLLGNSSVNHYTQIEAQNDGLAISYVLDLAEFPTFAELGQRRGPEIERYLSTRVEEWGRGLSLTVNKKPVPLMLTAARMKCLSGAGGLPTLRVEADFWGGYGAFSGPLQVLYRDRNFPNSLGWDEIVVGGKDVLFSSAPAVDRGSDRLLHYPMHINPPRDLEAWFNVRVRESSAVNSNVAAARPRMAIDTSNCTRSTLGAQSSPTTSQPPTEATAFGALFSRLSKGQFGSGVLVVTLLGAALLGAYHAMTPGHGKAILAAYFIGSRGTLGQAVLLGSVVTLTHTSGVFLLGFVTLFAAHYVAPEKLYPWLSLLSGVILLAVGASLFRQRWIGFKRGASALGPQGPSPDHQHGLARGDHGSRHDLSHEDQHDLDHHDHTHTRVHAYPHSAAIDTVRPRDLITLGVVGGILPCPSALIVMLAAISVGQIGFGLILITAFSVGLATVLTAGGILMVYARSFMARVLDRGSAAKKLAPWLWLLRPALQRLPVYSAAFVALLGLAIIVQTLFSAELIR